ncbi:glycosyltransferase family 2 protein [Paenibacillus alvei]|uniref:glycosyltransferase family 2 protein n=1 Tax=Paenibacillus alvei TaxID=44250 RepID=UPI00228208D8|nr:glycosyltransferase [Paenibacillus alvei]
MSLKRFLKRCLGKNTYEHHPDDFVHYENWLSNLKKRRTSGEFHYYPLISIVMPVYNVSLEWLKKAIDSIENQTYQNWELCIADDASPNKEIQEYLMKRENEKIKVVLLKENSHISVASNAALQLAKGDYIALLDHDDELIDDALFEVVKLLNKDPSLDLVYTDEDKKLLDGRRVYPAFKGGWNPEMLFSFMYVGHLGVYRKKIIDEIGGFRQGFEGAQDYDLILRFTEKTNKIAHLPKVLYHWRMIPGSTAVEVNSKNYAYDRGRLAVFQSLQRRKIPCVGVDEDTKVKGNYIPRFKLDSFPKVLLIIKFYEEDGEDTKKKLELIKAKTNYSNVEILGLHPRCEFNDGDLKCVTYSNNDFESIVSEVRRSNAEVLSILGSDIEPESEYWIEKMLPYALREEIAGVSGRIVSNKQKIQYSGGYYKFSKSGIEIMRADHNEREDALGYLGRIRRIQNTTVWFERAVMLRTSLLNNYLEQKNSLNNFDDLSIFLLFNEKLHLYHPFIKFKTNNSYDSQYTITNPTLIEKWTGVIEKRDVLLNSQITYINGKLVLKSKGDVND